MSVYERHVGAALLADPRIIAKLENHDAETALKHLIDLGGFIAGGAARAVMLSAMLGLSKEQLSDQYDDIDVFFTTPPLKNALPGDPEEWLDNAAAYVNAELSPPRDVGAFSRRYLKPSDKLTYIAAEKIAVTINAITFKHGSPSEILDDFDIESAQVAVVGDDIIAPKNWLEREQSCSLKLNIPAIRNRSGQIFKILKRIAKYQIRLKNLFTKPVLMSETDTKELISVFSDRDRVEMRTKYVDGNTSRALAEMMQFEDCVSIAMMAWPEFFMNTMLVKSAFGCDWLWQPKK